MSMGWVIFIIVVVLCVIASNILLLRDSKSFDLPDSYKDRKAAEAEHLKAQGKSTNTQKTNKDDDSTGFY